MIQRMRRNFDLPREGPLLSFAHVSRIAVLLRTVKSLKRFLWLLGALYTALFLSLFVINNFHSSLFGHSHFGADSLNLPTNVSPVVSSGIGQTPHSAQTAVAFTATEPCQARPTLPSTSSEAFNRLGADEYFNVVDDMCSQSFGIEEIDLLERSYEDYLEGSESVIAKGRLRINVNFWESIDASQFVLSVIKEGYRIPFYYTPTPVYLQNNKSSLQNSDFVFSAISELLKVGSVVECPFPPVVINPLSVSIQPNGKKRLILDLRHVNFFVRSLKLSLKMLNCSSGVC